MIKSGDSAFTSKYSLKGVEDYNYLKDGDCSFDGDDKECFGEVM